MTAQDANDEPPPGGGYVSCGRRIGRREFLARAAAAGVALAVTSVSPGCGGDARGWRMDELGERVERLSAAPWRALEAAQDVMLPSAPDSPGARDVNAIGYLDAAMVLLIPADEREIVLAGAERLDRIARSRGAVRYAALSASVRADVLHVVHDETHGDFTSVVLRNTLDAFLGDPVYGVNTDEVAWKWLGVPLRRPRPPAPARRRPR